MRLIDADALKKHKVYSHSRHEYIVPVAQIDWAPTVEQMKHARWKGEGDPVTWTCSNCGYHVFTYNNTPYCPNCGARMDGKEA